MVNHKEDWQAAFGQPSASFDVRVQQTLERLEEEKPMKKVTLRAALIAVALILAVIGTVYAATSGWNIGDYFDNVYGDRAKVPEDFASNFDQTLTQQVGDVVLTIRDAYVDDTYLHAIVTFARADGKPALFLMADLSLEDTIENLFRDGREDSRTIAEYAAENNLPIHHVGTWFEQDVRIDGSMDVWLEEDGTTAAFVTMDGVDVQDGSATLIWKAQVIDEQGEKQRGFMEIRLKTDEVKTWEVAVNRPVEGLPLTLDTLHLRQGRMGLYVDVAYSIRTAEATEAEIKLIQDGIWFEIIDPETGSRMPSGATLQGSRRALNEAETAFLQRGESLTADFDGDTLHLRAYDCWEKTRYGTVAVKIK